MNEIKQGMAIKEKSFKQFFCPAALARHNHMEACGRLCSTPATIPIGTFMDTILSPAPFLTHVNSLFAEIETWLRAAGLKILKTDIEINEEDYGSYHAPKITVLSPAGTELAEITPVGASILGANGRVDMQGFADKIILLDMDAGGPIRNNTGSAGKPETTARPLFRGIDSAGWYWIENRISNKAHKLNSELFFDLLTEVADYAPQQ